MNFLEDHFTRELGGLPRRRGQVRKSIWHQSHRMLRHVVLSKQRKFKKVPALVSNGQVLYEDGKLFLAHKGTSAMDCYFLREGGKGYESLSKILRLRYSIPLKPTWKDQVIQTPHSYIRPESGAFTIYKSIESCVNPDSV